MTSYKEWPSDGGPHTSDSIGQALAGLVARDSSGNPVAGMLAPPAVAPVAGAWKVQVGRFVFVRNVAGAARFSGLSNAEQVDVVPATAIPAGQSRIDRVAWDAATGELVYVQGVAGTSPAAPSIGANAPVVRVLVQAGDAQVVAARVTLEAVLTGGAGDFVSWVQAGSSVQAGRALLRGGWQNLASTPWSGLHTQLSAGRVEVAGAVTKSSPYSSLEAIFALPDGMRPAVPTPILAAYGEKGLYVLALPTGDVVTVQAGVGGQVTIGGSFSRAS